MEFDAKKNVERLKEIREKRIESIEYLVAWEEAERRKFR